MKEKLTLTLEQLCVLFGREPADSKWIGSADSEEYLAVVTYLVNRVGSPKRHQ